jgi:hypothetical protein
MPLSHSFTFSALEMSVRYGDDNSNNEDIISCYVHMGLERAKTLSDITAVQHAHMRVINTLIEAMCDHCLASVWRKQCYRYIKRLLPLLYEMLNQQQYQQKTLEIHTLHAYFLEDNQNKKQLHTPSHSDSPSMKK